MSCSSKIDLRHAVLRLVSGIAFASHIMVGD